MQSIFDMDSYSAPVDYLISQYIREYDMSKANINILLYYGMISKEQYQYYYDLPKKQREISIGCLQRDHMEIKDALKQGFVDMRHKPSADDYGMIEFMKDRNIPFIIVMTKADKLKVKEYKRRLEGSKAELETVGDVPIIPFSAVNGSGADEIKKQIEEAIKNDF